MRTRPSAVFFVLCLTILTGLSGCASKYGEQTAIVRSYADCYAPIQTLRDEENRVAKTTAGSALAGGLLGALVGGLATGRIEGAIAGGIAGSVAGGAGGYFYAVRKQNRDQNARMARYMQDINGDISNLNTVTASARMAIQCYETKFDTSVARYKEKSISREQFEASRKEILSGIDEAERILGKTIVSAREKEAQYQAAINEEEKLRVDDSARAAAPAPQARTATRQTVRKSPFKPAPAPGSLDKVKTMQTSYRAGVGDAEKVKDDEITALRDKMNAHMS